MNIQRLLSEGMRLISKALNGDIAGGVELAKDVSAILRSIDVNVTRIDEINKFSNMVVQLVNKHPHLDSLLFYVDPSKNDIESGLKPGSPQEKTLTLGS